MIRVKCMILYLRLYEPSFVHFALVNFHVSLFSSTNFTNRHLSQMDLLAEHPNSFEEGDQVNQKLNVYLKYTKPCQMSLKKRTCLNNNTCWMSLHFNKIFETLNSKYRTIILFPDDSKPFYPDKQRQLAILQI